MREYLMWTPAVWRRRRCVDHLRLCVRINQSLWPHLFWRLDLQSTLKNPCIICSFVFRFKTEPEEKWNFDSFSSFGFKTQPAKTEDELAFQFLCTKRKWNKQRTAIVVCRKFRELEKEGFSPDSRENEEERRKNPPPPRKELGSSFAFQQQQKGDLWLHQCAFWSSQGKQWNIQHQFCNLLFSTKMHTCKIRGYSVRFHVLSSQSHPLVAAEKHVRIHFFSGGFLPSSWFFPVSPVFIFVLRPEIGKRVHLPFFQFPF